MLLKLDNICKNYAQGKAEVQILKNINLHMEEGEYLAIMGPSGSGKTTLMNIIGCLDVPTSGSYYLDGENLLGYSEKQLSNVRLHKIGFVFQSYILMPQETALENVCLPLLYAGVSKKRRTEIAEEALERVGLADRMHHKPTQLSGGQCQRVAIARAIVNRPKLLLADEPTGALDSKSGAQIMELFAKLHDEGSGIIMITHDASIAQHASRMAKIFDGRITEDGSTTVGSDVTSTEKSSNSAQDPVPANADSTD